MDRIRSQQPACRLLWIALGGAMLVIASIVAGIAVWYFNRPLPPPVDHQPLFQGITYTRVIRRDPRPMIVHIVTIDLTAPGIHFLVTPPDDIDGFDYRARTVPQFMDEFDVQLAINGGFFEPWRDFGPLDYYPHVGDGVQAAGVSASRGTFITQGLWTPEFNYTLYITADNRVSFHEPVGEIYNALSGNIMLVEDGQNHINHWDGDWFQKTTNPHTGVGVNASGDTMTIIVVDGRQPNYSEGATLTELADLMLEQGATTALNLDGGGSSTLVMEGEDGQPVVLSSPVHNHIPGNLRPVANQFGVYAEKYTG